MTFNVGDRVRSTREDNEGATGTITKVEYGDTWPFRVRYDAPTTSDFGLFDSSELELIDEPKFKVGDWVRVTNPFSSFTGQESVIDEDRGSHPRYHVKGVSYFSENELELADPNPNWCEGCTPDDCTGCEVQAVPPLDLGDKKLEKIIADLTFWIEDNQVFNGQQIDGLDRRITEIRRDLEDELDEELDSVDARIEVAFAQIQTIATIVLHLLNRELAS